MGGAAESVEMGGEAECVEMGGAAECVEMGGAAECVEMGGAAELIEMGGAAGVLGVGATVRMVINYRKTQKTILRVNPRVPLAQLLPAICDKCEFAAETTVLFRDVLSPGPLDLSNSLNDYAIRDVYARDTKDMVKLAKDKNQKEKENKGFSMFRRSKKRSEQEFVTQECWEAEVLAAAVR
ncbi:hypothetical protein CRUP_010666 [Coryphaenoides rupestris]|nr:hypothetical protein CRUP_010666 [Coryphaenoides rupestris]